MFVPILFMIIIYINTLSHIIFMAKKNKDLIFILDEAKHMAVNHVFEKLGYTVKQDSTTNIFYGDPSTYKVTKILRLRDRNTKITIANISCSREKTLTIKNYFGLPKLIKQDIRDYIVPVLKLQIQFNKYLGAYAAANINTVR